jgi:tetratricopeptide (TPR) repeat protein
MDNYNDQLGELNKLFYRADNEIKDGLIGEALDTLTQIIGQDAQFGKAYNHLGWIYETKEKDYQKAEECYRLALKYASDYTPVYLNYAILLSTLKRYSELEAHLERSLEVPGINESKIWNERGIMYELQGRYGDAIEAYKKSIQLSLVNEDIERFETSINRCKKKRTIENES